MPRRVLHVMRMTGVSGSENHLLELVPALRAEGWRSDVLIPAPRPEALREFAARLAAHADRVQLVRMRADLSPALVRRLGGLLRSGRYALGHAHLVHADWHLAAASVAAPGVPLVSSKHNHDPFRQGAPFRLVERLAMRRFRAVITISDSLREFTERFAGVPAVTVHYGLAAPDEPRPPAGDGDPRLLAVGRLEPQKGYDVLVEAIAEARRRVPGVRLAIAGEGGERPALERLIAARGLDGTVELLGRREDVPELLGGATAFVHAARWEGFGLVLAEAMRAARPVVSTSVGAIPEVVEDGVTGMLVPPDDPGALAGAIVELVRDPARAAAMGEAGFRRLRERFSPERMARSTAALYDRVIESTASR